jgi:5-methyltetrahydrofolate--homocysteine methyltransferase
MEDSYQDLCQVLVSGEKERLLELSEKALNQGVSPADLLNKGLIPGMEVVGDRMKNDEMFIPEVLRSARAMQAVLDMLTPLLSESDLTGLGTFVIGTVEGDLHDIGKNLVSMMLKGAGFKVVDLGVNVKPETFVETAQEHGAAVVGMSALLTTTVPKMRETVLAFEKAGLRGQVKIMAGGAPITQNLADDIGADAYGNSATMAVEKAKALLE